MQEFNSLMENPGERQTRREGITGRTSLDRSSLITNSQITTSVINNSVTTSVVSAPTSTFVDVEQQQQLD